MDLSSYKFVEEVALSRSYPGLKTVYLVNEVSVYVTEPHNSDLRCIGLPDGNDFCISRVDGSEIVVTQWSWKNAEELQAPCIKKTPSLNDKKPTGCLGKTADGPKPSASKAEKQRLPVPDALPPSQGLSESKPLLERVMKGASTNWSRAKRAATLIRALIIALRTSLKTLVLLSQNYDSTSLEESKHQVGGVLMTSISVLWERCFAFIG